MTYLWEISLKMDEQSKQKLLKLLGEAARIMEPRLLETLSECVIRLREDQLEDCQLDLLHNVARHSVRSKAFVSKVIKRLWELSSAKDPKLKKKATFSLLALHEQL